MGEFNTESSSSAHGDLAPGVDHIEFGSTRTNNLQQDHRDLSSAAADDDLGTTGTEDEAVDQQQLDGEHELVLLHQPTGEPSGDGVGTSWASNILFLFGSILYVWVAVWDIRNEATWDEDSEDGDDDDFPLSPYMVVSAGAALCYVFDAGFQITMLQNPLQGAVPTTNNFGNHHHGHLLHRFRHMLCGQIAEGVTFGMGALLDFISAVTVEFEDQRISNVTAIGAVHAYLINAVILLAGKKPSVYTLSDRLEVFGDLLFVIGCIIDVFLSYFYNDETTDEEWKLVDRGNLVSAALWLLDAILYIAADCCSSDEDDNSSSSSSVSDAASENEANNYALIQSAASISDR